MIARLFLCLLLLAPCLALADAFSNLPPAPSDSNGRVPISKSYAEPWRIICANPGVMQAGATTGATATDSGETNRIACKTIGPISRLKLKLLGRFIVSGSEDNAISTVFYKAAIEYPDGAPATPPCFSGAGAIYQTAPATTNSFATACPWLPVYPAEAVRDTYPLGIIIPANTTFRIRYAAFVAVPPGTAAAVGSTTTGALAPTTQYFYKATCLKANAESGPSAEVTATTTGTILNNNVTLTFPTTPVGCDSYKLYRSTTTNTEVFLASVIPPTQTASATVVFGDAGQFTPGSAAPPVANRWPKTSHLMTGNSTTASSAIGASTDVVSATGTGGMITAGASPVTALVSAPPVVLADDITSFPVCMISDSLGAGRGIQTNSAENNLSPTAANYFNQALPPGVFNSLNLAISGTTMGGYTGGFLAGTATARLGMLEGCAYEFVTLSINDLAQGRTWQQIALDRLIFAQTQTQIGRKVYFSTLGMAGTSTDNGILLANQTPVATESGRATFNTWVRSGMQVRPFTATNGAIATTTLTVTGSSAPILYVGAPVIIPGATNNTFITALGTGTGGDGTYTVNNLQNVSGAMTSTVPVTSGGTPQSIASGYWDLAAAEGEVNSSGVPTLNGGFFPAAILLGSGTFSGSPTTTTQPFSSISGVGTITSHSLIGITVQVTSGAANGQNCVIAENTTANMTCNGGPGVNLTIAPAAGDTFNVYSAYSNDSLHPTLSLNTQMATGTNALGLPNFQTFATKNFGGY